MATVRRIAGDLHPARHCCHACPDLSPRGRRTVPTTACLYDPETAGPTRQWGYRRRQERHKTHPLGLGPQESAGPSHGPHTPLTTQDGESQ